jgi:uncharacterized membrane-anchored protein
VDPKEKNKESSANQQEKLKKREEVAADDEKVKSSSAADLREKLSNKNADYVFRLQKELEAQGKLTAAEAKSLVDKLLPEIIVAQRKGQPANNLFKAAPKLKAEQILHPAPKKQETPTWQRMIDGVLFYIVIMTGLFGVLALFQSPKQAQSGQMGIVSLILVGLLLGLVMTKYNDLMDPRKKRKGMGWLLALYGVAIFVGLLVIMYVFQSPYLKAINPVLPAGADIAIAAILYLVRFAFRRYFKITGSPFYPDGLKNNNK